VKVFNTETLANHPTPEVHISHAVPVQSSVYTNRDPNCPTSSRTQQGLPVCLSKEFSNPQAVFVQPLEFSSPGLKIIQYTQCQPRRPRDFSPNGKILADCWRNLDGTSPGTISPRLGTSILQNQNFVYQNPSSTPSVGCQWLGGMPLQSNAGGQTSSPVDALGSP
jgi:hypothetical protein